MMYVKRDMFRNTRSDFVPVFVNLKIMPDASQYLIPFPHFQGSN